jgi:hypothetical protein
MFSIRLGFKGCSQILHDYILGYYEWSVSGCVYVCVYVCVCVCVRPSSAGIFLVRTAQCSQDCTGDSRISQVLSPPMCNQMLQT